MTFPTVHLNGTSKQDLLDGYMNAASALRNAIEALAKAGPNGRDYYVVNSREFDTARIEHAARLKKVNEVLAEVEQIMENIADQGN